MVTDVQGWKFGRGKYLVTDPIIFSQEKVLGNVDWGLKGMEKWMNQHKCNKVCDHVKSFIEKDDALIAKLLRYQDQFKNKAIRKILEDL